MRVVLGHDGHNWHASLDSQVERTLFERQQCRLIRVTPRALGEDEHTLAVSLHFHNSTVKSLHSSLAVRAVDEHSPREGHEPAKEGDIAQRLLRCDTAVGRENSAQHQDVQLRLVISDEDGRPGREVLLTLDNIKLDTGGEAHHPLETAGRGPLRDSAVANESENDGSDHTVRGTQEQRAISGQTAGDEGSAGHFLTQGEQRQGHHHERANARQDIGTDRHDTGNRGQDCWETNG